MMRQNLVTGSSPKSPSQTGYSTRPRCEPSGRMGTFWLLCKSTHPLSSLSTSQGQASSILTRDLSITQSYNDILSFKKELATDSLINIIPIFYSSGGIPWDEVMPTIGDSIEAAVQRIDEATQKLIAMTRDNLELEKAVVQFIDGIKVNVTGNIGYS